MPKQAIRIPMRKSGRRLHWTFEVSANVEPGGEVSVEPTTRRRSRKKRETDELEAQEPVPELPPAPAFTAPDPIPPAEAPVPPAEASPAPRAAAPSPVALSADASSGSARAIASKLAAVPSLPAAAVRAHKTGPQAPPQVSPTSAPNGRGPAPTGPSRRAVVSEMIAMTAVAALVVVVVAVPHRTSAPTGPGVQAPRVQTADVTPGPASRTPSPVAAAPVVPPAAAGVAAVTRDPAPPAAPVTDVGKTAAKVTAADPTPARPPKADPPTWAELTRRRDAKNEPEESPNVAASIESVALAIGGTSPDAEAAPAAPAPAAALAGPLTTVTGCLEMTTDQEEFRLTETEGADAPKSRSWRSGFLRKRSAPVALIDGPGAAALKGDVGKRVAATGVLSGRDLALQSLRVVAASCE